MSKHSSGSEDSDENRNVYEDAEGDGSSKPSLYYVENNCEGIVCTICDSSVEWCDIARVLSCSRLFHKRCCNDSICPVCRDGKVSEEVEELKPAEKLNDMPAGTMEMKLEVPTSFEKLHHIFGNLQQYDNNGEEAEKALVVGDKYRSTSLNQRTEQQFIISEAWLLSGERHKMGKSRLMEICYWQESKGIRNRVLHVR